MKVICLQRNLPLCWLGHLRVVILMVICLHHPSVLTPISYKRSINTKDTTLLKNLHLLKKCEHRWVLYNQRNKPLEGEYLHSGLRVRFLEVQSVTRRKMCRLNYSLDVGQVIKLFGFTFWQSCRSDHAFNRSLRCGEKLSGLKHLTPIYWSQWMLIAEKIDLHSFLKWSQF